MGRNILVLDLETSGLKPSIDKIFEIGIVSLDLETVKIIELFDQVLREDGLTAKHRSSWIFSNSDMKVEDVRNAPPASEIYPQVQMLIDLYPLGVTAFNRQFDIGFLESRGIKFGKLLPCPMMLSIDICKIPFPKGGKGWKYPKVEEAYKFYFPESDYDEKHRGCDDAAHEAQICYKLYEMGIFKI